MATPATIRRRLPLSTQQVAPQPLQRVRKRPSHMSLKQAIGSDAYSIEDLKTRIANSAPQVVEEIFLQAAKKSYALAIACLAKDPQIDKVNLHGNSSLHLAIQFADADIQAEELIEAFVDKSFDLSSKNSKGQTALHIAALLNKAAIIDALLKEGADFLLTDENGKNAFEIALQEGKLKALQIFGKHTNLLNKQDENHNTLLTASIKDYAIITDDAAKDKALEKVDLLFQAGANVNAVDGWKNTPLHIAAMKGCRGIAERLIEAGADLTAKNRFGHLPVDYAIREKKFFTSLALLKSMKDQKIEADIDLTITDKWQNTALHTVAKAGDKETAEWLIKKGADLTRLNASGDIPLHDAIREMNREVGHVLLRAMQEQGIDLVFINNSGETPESIAKENGFFDSSPSKKD